jgi:ubiquitin carboxyl-terminal hydrolase 47
LLFGVKVLVSKQDFVRNHRNLEKHGIMALVVYTGNGDNTSSSSYDSTTRDESGYVGLSNQGATCYLNSLLQTLFMTPEFRRAIFTWHYDRSKHTAEQHCIPLQLQRLFGQLALGKLRAVDTVALTKSFGWEGSEVFQQQDVQELTRVLFDALEETFKGTEVENVIDQLYAGELIDYLRCIDVEYESERRDKFLGMHTRCAVLIKVVLICCVQYRFVPACNPIW